MPQTLSLSDSAVKPMSLAQVKRNHAYTEMGRILKKTIATRLQDGLPLDDLAWNVHVCRELFSLGHYITTGQPIEDEDGTKVEREAAAIQAAVTQARTVAVLAAKERGHLQLTAFAPDPNTTHDEYALCLRCNRVAQLVVIPGPARDVDIIGSAVTEGCIAFVGAGR